MGAVFLPFSVHHFILPFIIFALSFGKYCLNLGITKTRKT